MNLKFSHELWKKYFFTRDVLRPEDKKDISSKSDNLKIELSPASSGSGSSCFKIKYKENLESLAAYIFFSKFRNPRNEDIYMDESDYLYISNNIDIVNIEVDDKELLTKEYETFIEDIKDFVDNFDSYGNKEAKIAPVITERETGIRSIFGDLLGDITIAEFYNKKFMIKRRITKRVAAITTNPLMYTNSGSDIGADQKRQYALFKAIRNYALGLLNA